MNKAIWIILLQFTLITGGVAQQDTSVLDFSNKVEAGNFRFRENSKFNLKYIDVEEGLSSSFIQGITEDGNGNIWIGTWGGGIMKYDGSNIYKLNSYTGLPNNVIFSMYCDSENGVWATFQGGGLYCIRGDKLIKYGVDTDLEKSTVKEICEVSPGNYWVITYDSTFFEIREGKVTNLTDRYGFDFKRAYDIDVWQDYTGLATSNGLYLFQKEKLLSRLYENKPVYDLAFKNSNEYLVNVEDRFWYIARQDTKAIPIPSNESKVNDIIYDRNGNFWITSYVDGAYKYHISSGKLDNFNEDNGLTYNNIWSIYADSRKNVWIGTRASGICRYDGDLFQHYTESDGLTSKTVWALTEDQANRTVYLGLLNGGLCKFQNDQIEPMQTVNDGLIDKSVRSNYFDSRGNLWIGTLSGLMLYDKQQKLQNYSEKHPLLSEAVFRIKEDKSDGGVLVMTDKGIVKVLDGKVTNPFEKDTLNNLAYCDYHKDAKQRIWLGTEYGITVVDEREQVICKDLSDTIKGIAFTILEDRKGNVWVGTRTGIYVYTYDDQIIHITEQDGLTSDIIWSMGEDEHGAVWAGTEFGLSKLFLGSDGNIAIEGFGIQEGFTGNDCTQNGLLIDQDGNFWWGTSKKLTVVNPELSYSSSIRPNLNFNDVTVHYNSLNIFNGFNELMDTSSLQNLEHTDNYITIHFAAIDWGNESKLKYRYFLEGFSKNWSPYTTENAVTYSNLPPGEYTFKVSALSNTGLESEVKELAFKINPAFWQTIYFKVGVVLLAGVLVYLYFLFKTRRLRKNKHELERKVKERTEEIMEKNEELNMQNEEIMTQSEEIFRQNDILKQKNNEINESINVAERIQQAFFKEEDREKEKIPDHFVIFEPRNVVSGDFYWSHFMNYEGKNYVYLSVVDCTGHGVPGAFMSMLGLSFLKEIFNNRHDREPIAPGELLDVLRAKLVKELGQATESDTKEGMDISVIMHEVESGKVQFAGANNPLYYIKEGKMSIIKADKQPIGYSSNMTPFKNHTLQLEGRTSLYLFSDGFADQFGGPKGKKYGYKRLREKLLEIHKLDSILQRKVLLEEFRTWMRNEDQVDDVCLIGLKLDIN